MGYQGKSVSAPRRCLHCRRALLADADPRRRFCTPACVARAYRKRVRTLRKRRRQTQVIALFAQLTRVEKAGIVTGCLQLPGIQCPVCGQVVWQGVRRRADAIYCSNACRQAAHRNRKHDGKP